MQKRKNQFVPIKRNFAPNVKRFKVENELIAKVQSQSGIRGKLVLVYRENDHPYPVLLAATEAQGFSLTITVPDKQAPNIYELQINNEMVVRGQFETHSMAKDELSRLALKNLQHTCFSIIRKQYANQLETVKISPDVFETPTSSKTEEFDSNSETVKSSIGARMMKLMGWSGGGLGRQEEGDKNIIKAVGQNHRLGLGQATPVEIEALLKEYAESDDIDSLAFPAQFTKEQRALIHTLSNKYNLKSQSYGKKDRLLTVRKKLKPWQLVHHLLEKSRETVEYKLILPLDEEDDKGK
ncbi:NF-kappa-B-repressing factor [Agrilus planipennis]|uniref:NF-kappa-B-repressing factor n=1 Tax=Agrilus planipennis TaxID=224129 RepID=A0A7F5R9M0_AGRPL|nr:NF-kappa-B-repressing factor [Agrilus planipennis]